MNVDLMKKVAAHVKNADTVIAALKKKVDEQDAILAKVKELAPQIADLYVKNAYIPGALREKTAAALSDPIRALELVRELVSKPNPEAGSIGTLENSTKSASHDEPAPKPTKAEEQFLRRLGLL